MTFKLSEHIALETVSKENGVRRVRLISPGQGSSGIYSAEMLNKYVAEALPKGTKVYLNHTDMEDEYRRDGTRRFEDVAGKLISDPVYEADAPEGEGSYADVKFIESVEKTLKEIGDVVGVSVEVHAGRKDEYGNIVEMHHHPLNSLALVPEPGRDGRIFESFRAKASEDATTHEGIDMPLSKEEIEAVATRAAELVTEALKPEPKNEDEPDVVALVAKVSEAKLPEPLVARVVESVLAGADVNEAITEQTKLVEAIRGPETKEEEKETPGVFSESLSAPATKPKNDKERGQAYLERIGGNK